MDQDYSQLYRAFEKEIEKTLSDKVQKLKEENCNANLSQIIYNRADLYYKTNQNKFKKVFLTY